MSYPVQFISLSDYPSEKAMRFQNKSQYYDWLHSAAGRFFTNRLSVHGRFVICKQGMQVEELNRVISKLESQYSKNELAKLLVQWIGFSEASSYYGSGTARAWEWHKICLGRTVHAETMKIWNHLDGSCGMTV